MVSGETFKWASPILIILLFLYTPTLYVVHGSGDADTPMSSQCGSCHQTEYMKWRRSVHANTTGSDIGITEVSCSFCHGSGSSAVMDYSSSLCGSCHSQRDHSEASMLAESPMADVVTCGMCHDPHALAVVKRCEQCHTAQGEMWSGSLHSNANVTCEVCHGNYVSYPSPPLPFDYSTLRFIKPWNASISRDSYNIGNGGGLWIYGYRINHTWIPSVPGSCAIPGCHSNVPPSFQLKLFEQIQNGTLITMGEALALINEANSTIAEISRLEGVNQTLLAQAKSLLEVAKGNIKSIMLDGSWGMHDPKKSAAKLAQAIYLSKDAKILALSATSHPTTLSKEESTQPPILREVGFFITGIAISGVIFAGLSIRRLRNRAGLTTPTDPSLPPESNER